MENNEIDLIEVIAKLWHRRKIIICFVFVAGLIGITTAFILPKQYSAQCTLGLETEDKTTRISVEGMSPFQSTTVGDVRNARIVSPSMYPDILFSVPFQKELIYTPLFPNTAGDTLSFYDYFIKNGNQADDARLIPQVAVLALTANEEKCLAYLKNQIEININHKDGNLKLTVDMPDPEIAAGLAQQMQQMLQDYIARFRIAKAQAALDFIEGRYEELKTELEQKQEALVHFREASKNKNSVQTQAEEKILNNDYELFFGLYSDIVKQREKAKMQVKEDMPVLTVIEPVVLPTSASKPKRSLIVLASLFLGLFMGCGVVLVQPFFSEISAKRTQAKTLSINRVKKIS